MKDLNGETPPDSSSDQNAASEANIDPQKPVEAVSDNGSETKELSQVETLENLVKEKEAKYVYLYAEFENFKKRNFKERSELIRFANESFGRDLLQVFDNLERALQHIPEGTGDNLIQGLKMVLSQFANTFEEYSIRRIQTKGKSFDPEFHEAVEKEPSDQPAGEILRELLSGYTLHDRLLRPARVVISEGPETLAN